MHGGGGHRVLAAEQSREYGMPFALLWGISFLHALQINRNK